MALITRLTRLFQADFHAVLDSIEEPDIQLKQAIREMTFELQQEQQALALIEHESEQLATLLVDLEQKLVSFDDELDICFDAKKDDLARDLIRRKLESEATRAEAISRSRQTQVSIEKRQKSISEHQQQLDNMKQKMAFLVDDNKHDLPGCGSVGTGSTVRNEEIEIAFLREKQQRAKS